MVSKVQKDKFEEKSLNQDGYDTEYSNKFPNTKEERVYYNTPEIPIADDSYSKKPPINLRIHNTKIIIETVNITDITGVAFDSSLLDENFRPKQKYRNKSYRKVWKWIHQNPSSEVTFNNESITLAKVKENDYYVMEGIKRVSALKFSKFESIEVKVIDYTGIYNKILERKSKVRALKSKSTKQIIKQNTGFKPVKPSFKPSPIKKA